MAKRRASGDGTLRHRSDGRWEGRLVVGHKDNGSPIYKNILARTQKEVQRQMNLYKEQLGGASLSEDYRMTLSEWLDRWLENYKSFSVRENTLSSYRRYINNYIGPHLGNKSVSSIKTSDVQKMYNNLKTNGRIKTHPVHGNELSGTMVRNIHMVLHAAMECALNERMILKNPTDGAIIPKVSYKNMMILNDEQLCIFMEKIKSEELWHDLFYTAIMTGMRRGEICGLKWCDFDYENGKLNICRTLYENLTVGEPKTHNGARNILLPPSVCELLKERKNISPSEWIFHNPIVPELPIKPSSAYNKLKKILADAGLPPVRFHDLRHTFATHGLASGVDPKTLAEIIGHSKPSFTLDRYTHVTSNMQENAANIMGDFYENLIGEEVKSWHEEKTEAAELAREKTVVGKAGL